MASKTAGTPYWFHVFQSMVFDGTLATLDGGAVKSYIAIKAHASFQDGVCGPGLKRIGELVGQSPRQVQRHIDALVRAGLLSRERRGRRNLYKVVEQFIVNGADAEWVYQPRGVSGLSEAFELVSSGKGHPDLRIKLETTTTTTTTTATLELVEQKNDFTNIRANDGAKTSKILNGHLDRIKSQSGDMDDI
jgi:DNA-binding transcriptional ArsR family regulator